jgi:RecA/RadA recombinase
MSGSEIDMSGIDEDDSNDNSELIKEVIEFCGGPDLIQVFGETGSGKTEFCTLLAKSAVDFASKDVLFIDTEKNLSENDRMSGVDYIYIPEWKDLYAYISGKPNKLSDDPFGENTSKGDTLKEGYDVVILDSMGFPALMQYDEYSIEDDADQFKVFQMLQYMSGAMKKYAQHNNALVVSTNQPGSELGDDGGKGPFGDKSLFAYKELWKSFKSNSSEVKTTCKIEAFRSRQAGEGKELFRLEISDSGTDIKYKHKETVEEQADEWTV